MIKIYLMKESELIMLMLFTAALILGIIPATIAHQKGRDFVAWYIYGVALFIVALIHSLVIPKSPKQIKEDFEKQGYTECPYCKEYVKPGATVCPHCQRDIK